MKYLSLFLAFASIQLFAADANDPGKSSTSNSGVNKEFALEFANDWIESWNAHDLEKILSHYADGFEMNSPVIRGRVGIANGKLIGKPAIGEYWKGALEANPDLHFALKNVFTGPLSITILYEGSPGRLVTETFIFNDQLLVENSFANYE